MSLPFTIRDQSGKVVIATDDKAESIQIDWPTVEALSRMYTGQQGANLGILMCRLLVLTRNQVMQDKLLTSIMVPTPPTEGVENGTQDKSKNNGKDKKEKDKG